MRGPWRSAISSTRSCGARARNPGRVRSFCYPWRSIQCFRFQGGLLMVADAVSARARTSIPYAGRFFLTLFLLALYVFGQRLPLPGIDVEAMLSLQTGRNLWSVLSLGLTPLITGFILVELFSLLIPPGRRLRRLGVAGRARLNRAALITSLLVAGVQAAGISIWMERMSSPYGAPIVGAPGLGFLLLTIVTLTAATAALFALCQLIS